LSACGLACDQAHGNADCLRAAFKTIISVHRFLPY
jgi:hypothetical protein